MKAKQVYCKEHDTVAYIPFESDDCPFCGIPDSPCLTAIKDEQGAMVGYGVEIDKKYVIVAGFERCDTCGEKIYLDPDTELGNGVCNYEEATWCRVSLYNDPWSDLVEEVVVHVNNAVNKGCDYGDCYDKLSDTSWADFRYLDCPICNRKVIRQSPANGYHSYTRILNYEEICIACFEKELLAGNVEPYEHDGAIVGMFFNRGELEAKGFTLVEDCFSIGNLAQLTKYRELVDKYIEEDFIVVNEYENLSMCGGEGTINLWVKSKEE